MRFDLASLTRRAKNPRRTIIPIRPIAAPATFASNLYAEGYAQIIAVWREAAAKLAAEYERSLSELQTDSAASVRVEIDQAEVAANAVMLGLRFRLERWAMTIARWHTTRWRANVLAATGVDLGTLIGPDDARETIAAVIERNVGLVRSISSQAQERMADSVFRGLTERKPAREVAKELRETVDLGRKRALRIASDQTVKISSSLNDERRRQAGIDSWIWRHSSKLHPRQEHVARDGKLYTDNPARVGSEYQGKKVLAPPATRPGQEIYCGCTAQACLIIT